MLLSANAGLPEEIHTHVVKYVTHIICEVVQNACDGTRNIGNAIEGYNLASKFGVPLAATAGGWDWALVKANKLEELVRFWIALAYAHGQRFMVQHPKQQWCFSRELGTHWYPAPIEAFAPVYQFIKRNADWFDGFEAISAKGLKPPENTCCTVRKNTDGSKVVVHVVNKDYDESDKKIRERTDVRVVLPSSLAPKSARQAKLLSYDGETATVPLKVTGDSITINLPYLHLWTVIAIG